MSQAEELLNTIEVDDIPTMSGPYETEPVIVIDENRVIHVPEELRRVAVQYDHNIEEVYFKCPRYWDNHDMSEMVVYINVKTPDNKLVPYKARGLSVYASDDKYMRFSWLISRDITQVKGPLSFLVCIKKTDSIGLEVNHWNSELNKEMYISEGLECDVESILDQYPALVTDILTRLSRIEVSSNQPYYDIDLTSEVTVEPDTYADNIFSPDDLIDFQALVTAVDNGQTIRVKFNTHVQFSFVDVIAVETLSFTSVMRYESDIILNGVCRTMSLDNHYAAMMLHIMFDGENYSSMLTYSPDPMKDYMDSAIANQPKQIMYGTEDLIPGESELETGSLYVMYE